MQRAFLGFCVAVALVAAPLVGPAANATPGDPAVRHCFVTILGEKESGELRATEPECGRGAGKTEVLALDSGVIAVHYTAANFTGSSLTIYGTSCTGGWLNMPTGWSDQIASTWSSCLVDHYDYFYLVGDLETTGMPSNLYALAYRTNSAQYN